MRPAIDAERGAGTGNEEQEGNPFPLSPLGQRVVEINRLARERIGASRSPSLPGTGRGDRAKRGGWGCGTRTLHGATAPTHDDYLVSSGSFLAGGRRWAGCGSRLLGQDRKDRAKHPSQIGGDLAITSVTGAPHA